MVVLQKVRGVVLAADPANVGYVVCVVGHDIIVSTYGPDHTRDVPRV